MEAEEIVKAVAWSYGITEDELKSRKRDAYTAEARQVAMYISYLKTDLSFREIGEYLGRCPATVYHGEKRIAFLIDFKPAFKLRVEEIQKNLGPAK